MIILSGRQIETVNTKDMLKFRQSGGCELHSLGGAHGNVAGIPLISPIKFPAGMEFRI